MTNGGNPADPEGGSGRVPGGTNSSDGSAGWDVDPAEHVDRDPSPPDPSPSAPSPGEGFSGGGGPAPREL